MVSEGWGIQGKLRGEGWDRSLEGGVSGRGNTKSKDPGTEMRSASLKNSKNRLAGAPQAKGRVGHGDRLCRAW